jgi:hypothetical protein
MTSAQQVRGVLYVHSARSAVCPHVEWAVAGVLGAPAAMSWTPQPAEPASYRTELSWQSEPGTAARLASALRGWDRVRFEVTEDPVAGGEGVRFSWTPELGLHTAAIGPHGDIMIGEDRLKTLLQPGAIVGAADAERAYSQLTGRLRVLLGQPWDEELEPFRHAAEGVAVRWLHRVG